MDKSNGFNKKLDVWNHRTTYIFGVILFSITLVVASAYFYKSMFSVGRKMHQLGEIAQTHETEILNLVQNYKNYLTKLTHNAQFQSMAVSLVQTFVPGKRADYKGTSEEYKKFETQLDVFLTQHQSAEQYKDLFFINRDGTIFYVNKGEMLNANLFDQELATSALAQSFERVKITLTIDISEFSVDPLTKEPALFILQPIIVDNTFVAIAALQLDETYFYKIIQDYSKLGQTGDIVLTKNVGANRVLFLSPSRSYSNIAFKKISEPDKMWDTPRAKASLGEIGFGTVRDTFGEQVIAAWRFVPQVNWGLVVKINFKEVTALTHQLRFLLCIFLLLSALYSILMLLLFFGIHRIKRSLKTLFAVNVVRFALWLSFIIGVLFSVYLIYNHYKTQSIIFKQTKEYAQQKIKNQADFIDQSVMIVEKITQMLVKDLGSGALQKEDIGIRITRELKALPNLERILVAFALFSYDPQKRLYGLMATREGETVTINEITQDYMIPGSEKDPESDWYNKTIKRGAFWSEPYFNKTTNVYEIRYSSPFYLGDAQEPSGVVALVYNLQKIIEKIRALEVGKSGYGIILSTQTGTFIYHPVNQYVKERVSLFDIAREQNNEALKTIADDIIKEHSGFGSYVEKNTRLDFWVAYQYVPSVKWTVGAIFSEEALDVPYEQLHTTFIWIFISVVIALLFLAMIISHFEQWRHIMARKFALLSTLIFAGSLITFWTYIREESYHIRKDAMVIRDQTSLDQYLEFIQLEAVQRNEPKATVVPTGLLLYTLNFSDATKLSISGYVWQRIKKGLNIVPGVRFPEAMVVSLKEVLRKQEGDYEIIGWNLRASFLQKHRYSWFPFDRVHVDIIIAPADFTSNIMLAPDFSGYQSLDIDPLPGITNEIIIPGFTLERSFFSYQPVAAYDEVGLEMLRKKSGDIRLHYNILMERKLTNPLIIFFLPLLIILFSIYAVLLITFRGNNAKGDVFTALSSYTAIFFTLVILHQTLRTQYQVGELLYVEYFFFFTYITILLLILYSILFRVTHFSKFIHTNISPYVRSFYWTIQFGFWFIITMIMFYKLR